MEERLAVDTDPEGGDVSIRYLRQMLAELRPFAQNSDSMPSFNFAEDYGVRCCGEHYEALGLDKDLEPTRVDNSSVDFFTATSNSKSNRFVCLSLLFQFTQC